MKRYHITRFSILPIAIFILTSTFMNLIPGRDVHATVSFNNQIYLPLLTNNPEVYINPSSPDVIEVCGTIDQNTNWNYQPNTHYLVTCPLLVAPNVTLTIESGVTVKFESWFGLDVSGTLIVNGDQDQPVLFTAAISEPYPGSWIHISFAEGSTGRIRSAIVEYAGMFSVSSILVQGGNVTIQDSTIRNGLKQGVHSNTWISLINNLIHDNKEEAFFMWDPAVGPEAISIYGNKGWGNGRNAFYIQGDVNVDTFMGENPAFPYVIDALNINAGKTLTVGEGALFKFSRYRAPTGTLVEVNGTLNTLGTAESPVIFTSLHENNVGEPLYPENTPGYPSPGDWRGLVVNKYGSLDLDYTIIKYAGYQTIAQIIINSGSTVLDHVNIQFGLEGGIFAEDTSIVLRNSTIDNNGEKGFHLFGNQRYLEPVIQDNVFANNGTYGVWIVLNGGGIGNGTISGNTGYGNGLVNGIYLEGFFTDTISTLEPNPMFPYVIWTIDVISGAKLHISPGTVFKPVAPPDGDNFSRGSSGVILVHGTLEVVGTPTSPVIFTSFWDDSVGGDTNSDGNASLPQPADWWSYIVRSGGHSYIYQAHFRYGGGDGMTIRADGGSVDLNNSSVKYSDGNGIGGDGEITVEYSILSDNLGSGIKLDGPASIQWNVIQNNGEYGLVNYYSPYEGYRTQAQNNFWGDSTGPSYDGLPCPFDVPAGRSSKINCRVDWEPFLSVPSVSDY